MIKKQIWAWKNTALVPVLISIFILLSGFSACNPAFVSGFMKGLSEDVEEDRAIAKASHGINHDVRAMSIEFDKAKHCMATLPTSQRLKKVDDLNWKDLTDDSYITESEKKILVQKMEIYSNCVKPVLSRNWSSWATLNAAALISSAVSTNILLSAQFYNGELTLGQFNILRKQAAEELTAESLKIEAEVERMVNSSTAVALTNLKIQRLNNELAESQRQQRRLARLAATRPTVIEYNRLEQDRNRKRCRDSQGIYRIGSFC